MENKSVYKIDKDLAKIVSFITFDGHLHKDLKGFYIVSKDKEVLKEFAILIKDKFEVIGIYEEGTGYGKSQKYRIFNSQVSKFLYNIGVPKGDKMLVKFDVPKWVKDDKNLAKEYLKYAFYCEGTKFKKSKNTETIRINTNKSEELIGNGLEFMDSIKRLLNKFDINTTKSWVMKSNIRKKDGKTTKTIRFSISGKSINSFINHIGWIK